MMEAKTPTNGSPAWLGFDAYLFDVDGTLVNVRDGVHYHAFNTALREVYGLACTIDGVPWHGSTDPLIVRAVTQREGIANDIFEKHLPQAIAVIAREVARNRCQMRPELCPSVLELLTLLRGAGKLLGVVTGNLEAVGWQKLELAGLRPFFDFGCFSDVTPYRSDIFRSGIAVARRLMPGARVCVVGDTPSDIEAAREVGVPVIALASGTYALDHLRELAPDWCFPCGKDLLASAGS